MAEARTPPALAIPPSRNVCTVSIIDTTAHVEVPAAMFMEPTIPGTEKLAACCYAFLIKHDNPDGKGKQDTLLFDLGVRKDYENVPKAIVEQTTAVGVKISVEKNVVDILKDNGEDPEKVDAIIWSHWHFDHTGDPTTFPSSTDLIVGPGFKEAFVPAYPTVPDSSINESAWEGRNLREINFESDGNDLNLGRYRAYDFFGDGSFYLLDTPGHAIGHMCGLARTSADPPEFIFMGGDITHHGGEFRPTQYLPLPKNIEPNPLVAPFTGKTTQMCPGEMFEAIHPKKSGTEPFFKPTGNGVHHNTEDTKESIEKLYEFDAYENIFVNIAHDRSLYDVVEYFPKTANGWSQKKWKQEGRWRFLRDFDTATT